MSVVDALRQNNPALKQIVIRLRDETSDADLARALQLNTFVMAVSVDFERVQLADWGGFLRVIAARENLVNVAFRDADSEEERSASPALVSAILQTIQQNTAIQSIHLIRLNLPTYISRFVDTASSIKAMVLLKCDIMAPSVEREQGAQDLAAALERNTNIEHLDIQFLDDIYAIPILQGLRSNVSLTSLAIGGNSSFSLAASHAIQQLFESNTSIQALELGCTIFGGEHFHVITRAIISSNFVSKLKFYRCAFRADVGSAAHFRSILQNKRNLTGLCLDHCYFIGGGGQVHETIISALSQQGSPLRIFELKQILLSNALSNVQFQNLLRAVEKSKLEGFTIGDIQSQQQLHTLTDSIPLMPIKKLEIGVNGDRYDEEENVKQLLLQAVKKNFSLRSVHAYSRSGLDSNDIFNAEEKTRLVFYADRNELLDQWATNPEQVNDRKVWPEALKLAEQAGPDSLFRGLHSVLESDYISVRAGRKRKRPRYYAPR